MNDFFSEKTPWEIREQILKYNASQSMSDEERARFFQLAEGCRMREGAKILSPSKLTIGRNCWIGEYAMLDASGGLEIGENTSIGGHTLIWTHDSHRLNLAGKNTRDQSDKIIRKKTKIGSNCFIGGPSVIFPGVTVGNNCVISPMSVVYHDLPDYTLHAPYKSMCDLVERMKEKDKMITDLTDRVKRLEEKIKG